MNIIDKRLDLIFPYENNPRDNDDAVEYVAASIEEFGFKVPIIIDKDGVIVAGHTRYKAAMRLGMEEVPCIVADDLTQEQIKAFRLADNKVGEIATWDFSKLNLELEALSDFEMQDFGFYAAGSNDDDFSNIFDEPAKSEENEEEGNKEEESPKVIKVVIEVDNEQEAEELIAVLEENGYEGEVVK